MIKNVIFDIGNVLMTFDPYHYYKDIFQDDERTKEICNRIFSHEAWLKYDQGLYFLDDLSTIYHKEYPQYAKEIDAILKDWMKLMQPMPISFSLMKNLKEQGYRILILSNISKDSADYLKCTQPFFSWSDGAVLSYEEKIVKPNTEIYRILLERYHIMAQESLFIDDNKRNIEAAATLGIKGIYLDEPEHIERYVRECLEKEAC